MSDHPGRTDPRLRAAVESAPSGLLMVDRQGRIVLVNREIERLFAYTREEMLGQPLELLIPERFRDSHPGSRDGFLAQPSIRAMGAGRDLFGRRKDGTEIPVEIGLTPVATEEGMLVLAAVVDISERKRAEVDRAMLEEQLRHAQKMQAVGTLAGGIAHDFNNILAAIMTYAELVRAQATTPELRGDADTILEACSRGRSIVERVLSFSRRSEVKLGHVSVGDLVRSTETLLRATLPASVRIEVEAEGADTVLADVPSLEQVVMNLATNGAQAMPDGGVLRIGVAPHYLVDSQARQHPRLGEGWYVALSVEDSGVGIESTELQRVFEPFYTTKESGSGTGLGLSLVDRIVAEHGGAVAIDSEPGTGTSVRCLFPAAGVDAMDRTREVPEANALQRGWGERVLVLDDEPVLAAATDRRLTAIGYAVRTFTSAEDALAAFEADPGAFDLVVTDYTMPVMNGLEVADRIHWVRADVPIVMVTGYVDDLDAGRLQSSGVTGILRKPTTVQEMATQLRRALEG